MNQYTNSASNLTKNQHLVMTTLSKAKGPLSAYTILDKLRDHGFRAPLQVYRALNKLLEFGMVHRLESLNAFVACQQKSCEAENKKTIFFTICEECGKVEELLSNNVAKEVKILANDINFILKETVVELRGLCFRCNI